jgi:hypothetical protein
MHIDMHTTGIPGRHHDNLFALAARRAESALGRIADQVADVMLRLRDENGPRGGPALRCVAVVRLADGRSMVAEQSSGDWSDAMGRALERTARMVKRAAGRRRSLERH